ncbi:MAG TPA: hypothetical protein VHB21_11715, partial [Minicystis sp.]|nr:hypothetical protein [Minicystis sp.]
MHASRVFCAVVLTGLVATASVGGCSCGGDSNGPGGGGSGGAGGGGGGAGGGGQGSGKIKTAKLVTAGVAFDAALSDDGSVVYFTGVTSKGAGAVFSVPVSGGQPNVVTQTGLVAPLGLALSTDQKTLFVADPAAETPKEDGGSIFSVQAEGGAPSALAGTSGAVPRALDVVDEGNKTFVYFSGNVMGAPGVFKVGATGGAIDDVASGAPFRDPAGLAVARDGTVYVVDTVGGSRTDATVLAVSSKGHTTTLLNHADVGYPAGVALSQDEKALLVSGLRDAYGHAAVLRVDLASHEVTTFPV